jgi:hypothetical protein
VFMIKSPSKLNTVSINYIVPIQGSWNGRAKFISEGGVGIYNGDWLDGLPHGNGIFENDEYIYNGEFYKGDPHGSGQSNTMMWKTGIRQNQMYKGSIKYGQMSGYGHLQNVHKKYEYFGNFKNGLFHGEGKLIRSQRTFEGIFDGGKLIKGQYVDCMNRTYIGHFTNNKINGKGMIQFQDGFVIHGNFIDNKLDVEKYDDVVPPVGKFDGRKYGLLETKFGWYIGKWKDKKPHDKKGRIYGYRGGIFLGELRKGKKICGIECFSDGRVFKGTFKKNAPLEGKMVYYGQNKNYNILINNDDDNDDDFQHTYFKGLFNEKGLPTSQGIEYNCKTGILYSGFFLMGKYYNNGTVTFANNFKWTGKFNKLGLPTLPYFAEKVPIKGRFGPLTVSLTNTVKVEEEAFKHMIQEENNNRAAMGVINDILEHIIMKLETNSEKEEIDDEKGHDDKINISSDIINQPFDIDNKIDDNETTGSIPSSYRLYHGSFLNRKFHGEGCIIDFNTGRHKTGIWDHGVLIEKKQLY